MPGQGMRMQGTAQLTLTPRLQQSVRLLQLASEDFTQELDNALVSNPFLEDEEDEDPGYESAEDCAWGSGPGRRAPGVEGDPAQFTAAVPTLRDHLREQLLLARRSAREWALALLVIDGLDEDGYLRHEVQELAALAGVEPAASVTEIAAAIELVQGFEPAGVAARNLSESLRLQLGRLPGERRGRELALRIASGHLKALAGRRYSTLPEVLGCEECELHAAHALIREMSPRPGSRYGAADTRYLTPDVIVHRARGRWIASINPSVRPRIRINQAYAHVLREAHGGASHEQLRQQLQEARWLVRHAEQRFVTILKVADVIVARQRNFFEYGEIGLKPLGIRDVAGELGLHESTVSRATGNKYMATPRGIFLFRHFFSRELATENGGRCGAAAIRALIREFVAAESPGAPLSDAQVTRLLGMQGILVARRTVTKYRGSMRIPALECRRTSQLLAVERQGAGA